MKKKFTTIILCSSLLLSACGTTTATNADSTSDPTVVTTTTESEVQASAETPTETETEETSPLQALIDQYGSCYSSDSKPTVGQLHNFNFKDTVSSVEDICSSTSGTYVLVHFEDSRKDTIIIDGSRTSENEYSEISEILDNAKTQINLPLDSGLTYEDVAPQPGDQDTFRKELIVSEIQETEVENDETSYYIIKSDNGLESLIGVFKYQNAGYIPMVGEIMEFHVEDTVTSVEESMQVSTFGVYTPIHFENASHNMVVLEKSTLGTSGTGDNSEWEDVESKLVEFNQYSECFVDQLPQPGEQVCLEKSCEVVAVTLEKENDKGTQFYTVEGAGGIQAQIMVRKSNIAPNGAWEYGSLTDGIYHAPAFGMKIDLIGAELNDFQNRGTDQLYIDITDNKYINTRRTTLSGWKNSEHFSIQLEGLFFEQDLTEDTAFEIMSSYCNFTGTATDITRTEDTVIGEQTYYTLTYKNIEDYEVQKWYRFENNKIYLISISSYSNQDASSILAWMSKL